MRSSGFDKRDLKHEVFLNLRYNGTGTSIMVKQEADWSVEFFERGFKELHEQEFGFNFPSRSILIDNIRVRSVGNSETIRQ